VTEVRASGGGTCPCTVRSVWATCALPLWLGELQEEEEGARGARVLGREDKRGRQIDATDPQSHSAGGHSLVTCCHCVLLLLLQCTVPVYREQLLLGQCECT